MFQLIPLIKRYIAKWFNINKLKNMYNLYKYKIQIDDYNDKIRTLYIVCKLKNQQYLREA